MLTSRTATPGNAQAPAPQSVEAVRRRARHRLIGAAVLVLLGVLGFPMLFDTQPRPMAVDIPIEIPSRTAGQAAPVATKNSAPVAVPAEAAPAPSTSMPASESLSEREEMLESRPAAKAAEKQDNSAKSVAKVTEKAAEKPAEKSPPKPQDPPKDKPAVSEAARAKALLEDAPADKVAAATNERIVVQVGAFADATLAREARLKLERAGLKTYTHVAETPQGRRIRVRLGPFATRADAEKAAARAKSLGLGAAILTL
jgi:DedD protein